MMDKKGEEEQQTRELVLFDCTATYLMNIYGERLIFLIILQCRLLGFRILEDE